MVVFLAAAALQSTVVCPVMGVDLVDGVGRYDYGGVRIGFCCMACRNAFETDPAAVVESAQERKRIYGEFLFDPITRRRIEPAKAEAHYDSGGIRFYIAKRESVGAIGLGKRPLEKMPKKEALYCPAKGVVWDTYARAVGYGDLDDVRYYLDCSDCQARFAKDPSAFAEDVKGHVRAISPIEVSRERF